MTTSRPPLAGLEVIYDPGDLAVRHAAQLLSRLGATVDARPGSGTGALVAPGVVVGHEPDGDSAGDPASDWAASGVMWLTGRADGPPLLPPGAGATAARGALLAFELLSALGGRRVELPGHRLLAEHAAARGVERQGPRSPGGRFRLVAAADGMIGVSLNRDADLELLPALVERAGISDGANDPWAVVEAWAAGTPAVDAVARAQLLGIAASVLVEPADAAADEQAKARGQRFPFEPFVVDGEVLRPGRWRSEHDPWRPRGRAAPPLVVDLSALWAGPLCAHLLGLAGARVVKVESPTRPDGLRVGAPVLYDLLHAGHETVAVDFTEQAGRTQLRQLLEAADLVIEASRPRAMAQLGIDPAAVVARGPDRTWLSITAYGRSGPWAQRVGFGDDVAVAAGLAASDPATGIVVPCGDAIADPLTGVHAAVAALASLLGGGGRVIDVAMRDVVGSTLAGVPCRPVPSRAAEPHGSGWVLVADGRGVPVERPALRPAAGAARPLGADTAAVLAELDQRGTTDG